MPVTWTVVPSEVVKFVVSANMLGNQLTLKCTARSAWMHCKEKEAEESACGVHDPAFKMTEIYFQEKFLCNFLVKNGNY